MVTLDVRPKDEAEINLEATEPVDMAMEESNVTNKGGGENSTWFYSMPFPGVRYYSFDRPDPVKTPGKAAAGH
ncbi:MAG: hypothetical protein IID00_03800 [Chloroflexi bacterium]|nr:hypothetical protein [Chloroflexota bacterium]